MTRQSESLGLKINEAKTDVMAHKYELGEDMYVLPCLERCYGNESLTLNKESKTLLHVLEVWVWRIIFRIYWTKKEQEGTRRNKKEQEGTRRNKKGGYVLLREKLAAYGHLKMKTSREFGI